MNVAVTIFYILAGCYLVGIGIFALVKHIKAKKKVKKEVEDYEQNEVK